MERVLKATVARCAKGRRSDCPVIEALYRNGSASGLITPRPAGRPTRCWLKVKQKDWNGRRWNGRASRRLEDGCD